MSSPMRMVSPTLRVSVSTCTPPWVSGGRPWRARRSGAEVASADATSQRLSAQAPPKGNGGVGLDHLPGPVRRGGDEHRGAEVGRGLGRVPAGDADEAEHLRLA